MNREKLREIYSRLGTEKTDELYSITGSDEFSLAAVVHARTLDVMEEGFKNNVPNRLIVKATGLSLRSVQDYRKKYLDSLKTKPAPKN